MCFTSVSPYTANAHCLTGLTTTLTSSGTCINKVLCILIVVFCCCQLILSNFHSLIIILTFKNLINLTNIPPTLYIPETRRPIKIVCTSDYAYVCQMENGGLLCKPCARHHAASSAAGHHWQNQRASQSVWNSVFSCSHPRVTGTTTHIII